jgi:hypothetical protein
MAEKVKNGFRKPESFAAEEKTRKMLPKFLEERGFTELDVREEHNGQTIYGQSPWGDRVGMRVKLCWHRDRGTRREADRYGTFAAAQLLSGVKDDEWEKRLAEKVERDKGRGATHLLVIQRDEDELTYAALIPIAEVVPIWIAQRDISDRLLKEKKLGGRNRNHATKGSMAVIYLQEDRGGQEVAGALWDYPGVVNLNSLTHINSKMLPAEKARSADEDDGGDYIPNDEDERKRIHGEVICRRGREEFRDALRKRYRSQCVVTGCKVLDVLEAAHINPYRGEKDDDWKNGLLLRADIHTLFDLDLLGIHPKTLTIEIHRRLKDDETYSMLEGESLRCDKKLQPSEEALTKKYKEFCERKKVD